MDTNSMGDGEFVVHAPGGIRINPATGGCTLTSGAAGWACASDRALKANVVAVDAGDVLYRVIELPIAHMGPMAQDFHAAFGLGNDRTRIAAMDVQGVALAAIQGLNAKLEAQAATKDAEIATIKREVAELRQAVEVLMARTSAEGRLARAR